jgi:hypothetical protein
MRLTRTILVLIGLSVTASAGPILWTLDGVTFAGGGAASGSFDFDADTGLYSNVDITTTTGGGVTGATYLFTCGQDVASCTGVSPNSTEALFLATNVADETGLPAIAFFFTGIGGAPPQGLTDNGGTIDISNSSLSVGAVQEALCSNAACSGPAAPSRSSDAGTVVAPEPSSMLLVGMAVLLLGFFSLKRSPQTRL